MLRCVRLKLHLIFRLNWLIYRLNHPIYVRLLRDIVLVVQTYTMVCVRTSDAVELSHAIAGLEAFRARPSAAQAREGTASHGGSILPLPHADLPVRAFVPAPRENLRQGRAGADRLLEVGVDGLLPLRSLGLERLATEPEGLNLLVRRNRTVGVDAYGVRRAALASLRRRFLFVSRRSL